MALVIMFNMVILYGLAFLQKDGKNSAKRHAWWTIFHEVFIPHILAQRAIYFVKQAHCTGILHKRFHPQ
jgi:hypothetical protein